MTSFWLPFGFLSVFASLPWKRDVTQDLKTLLSPVVRAHKIQPEKFPTREL
jgi:hypothetical protein